jgi:hypothetical protein
MGWLDDIFGSKDTKTGTTTTETKLPDWVDAAAQNNYKIAGSIATRPYTPYPYARIAGFSGDQQGARDMLRGVGSIYAQKGTGDFGVPRMIDSIGEGGGVGDYMSPFVDTVLDRTMGRIREATDMAKQWQSNVGAHNASAFGDARHGIADSEIEGKGIDQMGDAAATAYASAYDDAQRWRDTDINRLYQTEEMNRGGTDDLMQYIDSLYRSGSNEQALTQSSMNLGYQDFLNQLNYPIENYNILAAALNGSPYGKTSTATEKAPGPSTGGQIVGTIGNILSAFLGG